MATPQSSPSEPPPSVALLNRIMGAWQLATIHAGAQLGIADLIHKGHDSASSIARETGWHEPSVQRLLRGLMTSGIVESAGEGRYNLTGQGNALRSDVPDSMLGHALVFLGGDQYDAWSEVANGIRTGASPLCFAMACQCLNCTRSIRI